MSERAGLNATDRRKVWQPAPRPEWAKMANCVGQKLDIESTIPLDEQSLIDTARRNTGLDDFGEDGWREHFSVLVRSIQEEAKLNFLGRVLTRFDLIVSLEARLRVQAAYTRHPEIEDEVIREPVFILGIGRAGTTILQETMSQDPQFGSVIKRDALFPAGNGGEGERDRQDCATRAQAMVDAWHEIAPEFRGIHAMGADLQVEDIEFIHMGFFSDNYVAQLQIPTYQRYIAELPASYGLYWHKRILKLLQWRNNTSRWLLKNPAATRYLPELIDAYPDAKIIFPHRDPVVSTDSIVNTLGAVFHIRTDFPYFYEDSAKFWTELGPRLKMWDTVMESIDSGRLQKGNFANLQYIKFMTDPSGALTEVYSDLGLTLTPDALDKMIKFLDGRHQLDRGNRSIYAKSRAQDERTREERQAYARYQAYFGVANEV